MTAPLEDVTVVEIDNWMASPSAAAILADLGANVIKVEPLTGDPMRNMGRPAKVSDEKKGSTTNSMFLTGAKGRSPLIWNQTQA